jgi:hypothetical protein
VKHRARIRVASPDHIRGGKIERNATRKILRSIALVLRQYALHPRLAVLDVASYDCVLRYMYYKMRWRRATGFHRGEASQHLAIHFDGFRDPAQLVQQSALAVEFDLARQRRLAPQRLVQRPNAA